MSRYKVRHNGQQIGEHASVYGANELAVAYMRQNKVSPVEIWDSESTLAPEFQSSMVHIPAYEGSPEVVAARALIASHGSMV